MLEEKEFLALENENMKGLIDELTFINKRNESEIKRRVNSGNKLGLVTVSEENLIESQVTFKIDNTNSKYSTPAKGDLEDGRNNNMIIIEQLKEEISDLKNKNENLHFGQ